MTARKLNQLGIAPILLIIGLVVFSGAIGGAYFLGTQQTANLLPSPSPESSVPQTSTSTLLASITPSRTQYPQNVSAVSKSTQTSSGSVVASPKPQSESIPLMSTNNWQEITYKGIKFKISPSHSFEEAKDTPNLGLVSAVSSPHSIPLQITVSEYSEGSRRDQYYKMYPEAKDECNPIYQEAQYGSVNGLQIAIDADWCQGSGGVTLVVVGNKLVMVFDSRYDPKTKQIYRQQFIDTLISTLRPA